MNLDLIGSVFHRRQVHRACSTDATSLRPSHENPPTRRLASFALTVFPDIVPFRLTVASAASDSMSQVFLLTGALVVTPVALAYNAFAYWVSRGTTPGQGWEPEDSAS
jgi:heme/copper-type cytochrome/quinol oxidase subunit 4